MTHRNKTLVRAAALATLLLSGCVAAPPPVAAQGYSVQGERAAHPRVARALDEMYAALSDLQAAPDVFGGHKAAAMADLQQAIMSTKRALYFRLQMDDRALMGIH